MLSEVKNMGRNKKSVRYVGALEMMVVDAKPLPSREQVVRHLAAGDYQALMEHYYPLLVQKALRYAPHLGDEVQDLIQEMAARVFAALKAWHDHKRTVPFSKYLTFWVALEADRAIREWFYTRKGTGYVSSRLVARVSRAARELQAELGRHPTAKEIAERLNIDEWMVQEALALAEAEAILSLDEYTNDEEETRFGEFVAQQEEDREAAFEYLEELIERHALRKALGGQEEELLDRFLREGELPEEDLHALEEALKRAMEHRQLAQAV